MRMKLTAIAVLAALLACALAAAAPAAHFTSKIGIRFVEATITDPPTPLSDGMDTDMDPTEPLEDDTDDTDEAARRARIPKHQRQCE